MCIDIQDFDSCEDETLLSAYATQGCQRCFSVLHARYTAPLHIYIFNKIQDHNAAEDVAQEAWIRLRDRHQQLKQSSKLRNWLFSIAGNLAIDFHRESKKRVGLTNTDPVLLMRMVPEETRYRDALDRMVSSETEEYVKELLDGLMEPKRTAFRLVYVDGCTLQEAANELNVPMRTAQIWARRGLLIVRKNLKTKVRRDAAA